MPELSTLFDTVTPALRRGRVRSRSDRARGIEFMELDRALIRYRRAGSRSKYCLVLSADPPMVLESYDRLLRELAADFHVIVFEAPGFGYSLPSTGFGFSMREYQEVIETFLERLGVGPCILGLPCLLGFVGAELAAQRRDLISHSVMIQQPTWQGVLRWRRRCDPWKVLQRSIVGQLALHVFKERAVDKWLEAAVAHEEDVRRFKQEAGRVVREGGCFCLASIFQSYLRVEPVPVTLEQPTLVLWGRRDRSHGKREDVRAPCPTRGPCVQHVFESHGHYPELEAPELFAGVVGEFFARTKE